MKRHRTSPPSSPAHKKAKPISVGLVQDDDLEGGEWTKVGKRKDKKRRKIDERLTATPPRFLYHNAEILKRTHAIGIDDIRELVLHIVADAPPPNWIRVENVRAISRVVALLIPGLTAPILSLPPLPTSATTNPNLPISIPLPSVAAASDIPFITSTFSHACPTRAPGDQIRMFSVLNTFFHGPVSGQEKKKRQEEKLTSGRAFALDKDPARYVSSLEQMIENDYPIPSYMADVFQKPSGWVETPQAPQEPLLSPNHMEDQTKIYAIDCEMCLTEDGKELTRVCMIDYASGIVIYDQLVKPPKPILDYLTRWSGITEAVLSSATTTLAEVQTRLLSLLSPCPSTPILLGHSLESDLKALKLCHPRCIDTALIFHHPRGRPLKPGLAWLTNKWCGREIQTRGESGHDPEEDARACLDLLKKKVLSGPGYGEFRTDHESIFERMSRSTGHGESGTVRSAVVDHGNPVIMHGAKATTTVPCKSDDEILDGLLQVIPGHQFIFGRFMALADTLGWTTAKASANESPLNLTAPPADFPRVTTPVLAALNQHLQSLHASLPPRTALLIFTGHSDPRRMAFLNARKFAFDNAIKSGKKLEELEKDMWWTTSDGRELEEVVELTKRGLMFICIKQ